MNSVITITSAAQNHIISVLQSQNARCLEVGVNGKGCNGMSYTFDIVDPADVKPHDEVIDLADGYSVIVPAECVMYLLGSQLDHENTMWHNRLTVSNPRAVSKCGCGTSFSVDMGTTA